MKLILEIAPGSIALIPSALITHENIPIRPEESRQAITAYTPANMFRYIARRAGGKLAQSTKDIEEEGDRVWIEGRSRFPHVQEFL